MKANTDKSHILLSGNNKQLANIDGHQIISEHEQVLLGVTIDSNLTFETHINNLCKKSSAKLNALARVTCYMDTTKRRILMKSFVILSLGIVH